jgi:hypothetical protein
VYCTAIVWCTWLLYASTVTGEVRHTSHCHTKLVVRTQHVPGGGGPPRFDSTIRSEILTAADLTSTYVLSEGKADDEDVLFSVIQQEDF